MLRAAIVGATGYTGSVLTVLLDRHPQVEIEAMTSMSYEGMGVAEVFPHLRVEGRYTAYDLGTVAKTDVAFVCYPHAQAHPVVAELIDAGVRVVDLSADFRLESVSLYEKWYGFAHPRPDLVSEAAYGLPELYRTDIGDARLVANPGCFPTAGILAVAPLAREYGAEFVVVDAKSGVSGAGRTPSEKTHFGNVYENFQSYAQVGHRHTPEMAEQVEKAAGNPVKLSFTPHLLPVNRGILATSYCRMDPLPPQSELYDLFRTQYEKMPFVEVADQPPSLRDVQHTNFCRIAARTDEAAGLVKIFSVIDNLVKGASGQAVQNMNIMFGLPETEGLGAPA